MFRPTVCCHGCARTCMKLEAYAPVVVTVSCLSDKQWNARHHRHRSPVLVLVLVLRTPAPLSRYIIRPQSTPRATLHRPSLRAGQQTGGAVKVLGRRTTSDTNSRRTRRGVEALGGFELRALASRHAAGTRVSSRASCIMRPPSEISLSTVSGRCLGLHEPREDEALSLSHPSP